MLRSYRFIFSSWLPHSLELCFSVNCLCWIIKNKFHTRNSCSALTHPKCTHTSVNTHTVNTHPEHCGAQGAVGGLVPCSRAPQLWYCGWRESAVLSLLPPPPIPAGPRLELVTFGLRVRLSNHLAMTFYSPSQTLPLSDFSNNTKDISKNVGKQIVEGSHWLPYYFFPYYESQWFGTNWGWVNGDSFIFWVNYPFKHYLALY